MFNKLEFNNKITSYKGEVQKARIQIIQKLIKRINFLKQKLNSNHKFSKRINVIAEEIQVLKKLNFRYIVKSALLLEKNADIILTSQNAKVLDRCLARFWKTKTLKPILENLKIDYDLGKIENLNALKNMGTKSKNKSPRENLPKSKVLHKKPASKFVEESISNKEMMVGSYEKNMQALKLDQIQNKNINKKPKKHLCNVEEENSNVDENTEDSFFVTSNGQFYLAAVSKATQENEFEKRVLKNIKTKNEKLVKDTETLKNDLHPSWKAKQRQKEFKLFEGKKIIFNEEGEVMKKETKNSQAIDSTLHPSWIAKQKAKPVIAEFVGKKIKFN